MKPLYIWAGGKNKMIKHYQDELANLSNIKTFVEPFFGGGAMTIYMYENFKNIERFVINDIKPEIISIYTAIKHDYENFINHLDVYDKEYISLDKDGRKEYFYNARHSHAYDYEDMTSTQESALLYFLMRTCFNGVWQINKNTNNRFGTPCGLLKEKDSVYDKNNLDQWNVFLQKADLYSGDWSIVSEKYKGDETFFFFDPPYRDSFTSYGESNDDSMQIELIEFCNNIPESDQVFLTNRDSGDGFFEKHIDEDTLTIKRVPVTYTAGRRKKVEGGFEAKKATEVLIYTSKIQERIDLKIRQASLFDI